MSELEATDDGAARSPVVDACVIGLFLLAAVASLVLARTFLMPVILAFLLSLTFSPVRRALGRAGMPAWAVATLVTLGLVGGILAALLALSGPVRSYVADAPAILREVEWKLRDVSSALESVSKASAEVERVTAGPGPAEPQVSIREPGAIERAAWNTPFAVAQFVLTLTLLFFLIASGDLFYEKLVQASPTFRDKRRAIGIAYDIERKISRYFLTIATINAGLGVSIGVTLWLLGMPNPAVFGAMAFLFNFVPYLGAILGTAITLAIGLVTYDHAGPAALAAAAYLTLTTIEGQLVTPYAVGRSLKLNPVVVFVAVAFWGWAWSVIGMIIAVPVLIALRAFCEHVPALAGLGIFLSGREEPDAPAPAPPPAPAAAEAPRAAAA
ncbi:MAG: AI-2E family transporter [Rhodobacteraceae bacterium]|nr:AI-2E family transporter [Paracoccaceae bacterium]